MRITDEAGVRRITFDRPDARNAFTTETAEALGDAVDAVDPETHDAVVLTGEGEAFCAGGDLASEQEREETVQETYDRFGRGTAFVEALFETRVPVVGRINGDAVGAGLSLVALCDVAVGVEDARFGAGFVKVGLIPDAAATVMLPELVGLRAAKDLLLTGRLVDAEAATRMGLLNKAVASSDLDDTVDERVEQLSRRPTHAIGWTRRAIHTNLGHSWMEAVDYENLLQAQASHGDEHEMAVEEFLAGREPDFS